MTKQINVLKDKLGAIPDVEVTFYKNSDLLCVFYKGKEVAHFQNEYEIDIRLTPRIIKKEGLTPPNESTSHPDRSKNSRWLIQSFYTEEDITNIIQLVQMAIELRK